MSEELDREVLMVIAELSKIDIGNARVVQRLWADRSSLVDALVAIQEWDQAHSEALSIERVNVIVEDVLDFVGER